MKKLILGATGSIGSSLAKKIVEGGEEVHLVGRDKTSLSQIASELNSTFTNCDVLEENFSEKIFSDLGDTPINGLAYCVGSIDLKPIKLTKKSDYMQSFNLNLISATEAIKALADNLKKNKGSVVLFSTVAIKQGFPNHAIVASAKVNGLAFCVGSIDLKPLLTATVENKTIEPLFCFKLSEALLIISIAEIKFKCLKNSKQL